MMSTQVSKANLDSFSPFQSLLDTVAKELKTEDVKSLKIVLQGHLNRESLQYIDSGEELVGILSKRGLVSEKKLAFFRKILSEAKCLPLVSLLDVYKDKSGSIDGSFIGENPIEVKKKRSKRIETLARVIEKIELEIQNCDDRENNIKEELLRTEYQINSDNERLLHLEQDISELKKEITEKEELNEDYKRKLEKERFFIKKNLEELNEIRETMRRKNNEFIQKELKEKRAEYEQHLEKENELERNYRTNLDNIRTTCLEIRHKTQELITIEEVIYENVSQIRVLKQQTRKIQYQKVDLQDKLQETLDEYNFAQKNKSYSPASRQLTRVKTQQTLSPDKLMEYKRLDYGEIGDSEATVFGRKGKRIQPPQFSSPCGVAVDDSGTVYVADYGNCRIQILDITGKILREPIELGKSHPTAITVTKAGDVIVTDRQIIRVFNNKGEPLAPILPIYSRNDKRPELCGLTVDREGHMYVVDKANHRVQKFRKDGTFLCFIGGPSYLYQPVGIAVTAMGHVIVSECGKHRLRIFYKEEGTEAKIIGERGMGVANFLFPRGITLDKDGYILVADCDNHRIQVVTLDGEYVGAFGRIGSLPGTLDSPHDVALDCHGNIIVADTKNNRIEVFTRKVPKFDDMLIDRGTTAFDSANGHRERAPSLQDEDGDELEGDANNDEYSEGEMKDEEKEGEVKDNEPRQKEEEKIEAEVDLKESEEKADREVINNDEKDKDSNIS